MFDISDITNFSCVCSLFVLLSTEEESGKYFAVANLAGKDLQLGEMMGIENLPLICKILKNIKVAGHEMQCVVKIFCC